MSEKTCKACGVLKPMEAFPTYLAKGKAGVRGTCRDCWNDRWTPVVVAHNKRYYHLNQSGARDKQKARTMAQHRAPGGNLKHRDRNQRFAARHPEKAAAKAAVSAAVRSGRLQRQPCEKCGARAQAHHDDYARQLDVVWLCPEHHGERHRLLRRHGSPSNFPPDLMVRQFPEVQ